MRLRACCREQLLAERQHRSCNHCIFYTAQCSPGGRRYTRCMPSNVQGSTRVPCKLPRQLWLGKLSSAGLQSSAPAGPPIHLLLHLPRKLGLLR